MKQFRVHVKVVNKRNKGLLGSLIKVGFNDAVSSERLLNQCIKGKSSKALIGCRDELFTSLISLENSPEMKATEEIQ